ncbi:tyrosine-type recombinase/integrase [Kocuria rosea]|uniref:tyrosine-type recombinase/integrase n=1 Tax=Kocuria rosea TaxID=1275 RepID=UPI00203F6B94|nr:tyrosine-type recombinase/integrase [Kocuria rosea]
MGATVTRWTPPPPPLPLPATRSATPPCGVWLASYGSANTREAYRRDATVYLSYLEATGLDLLLSTGVRISEALGARASALTADRLVITRKGGKSAVVPLPEHTVEALRVMAGTTGAELARGDEAPG